MITGICPMCHTEMKPIGDAALACDVCDITVAWDSGSLPTCEHTVMAPVRPFADDDYGCEHCGHIMSGTEIRNSYLYRKVYLKYGW